MTKSKIDALSLRNALDQVRIAKGWSWRHLATEIGVTPSLLSRLRNGYKPDADGYMTLVGWLGMPAESFLTEDSPEGSKRPELTAELAPLLRARSDLDETDIKMVQEVIQAALRAAAAKRGERE